MKKRILFFTLGVLMLFFTATTLNAAGSIPTSYNQNAQEILSMLWDKLDQAIVSNYDVAMLLRYHDHAGTDPGDFVTRGLPIGSGGITDNAVGSSEIAANAVGSSELANNAVDSGAILDGAVTTGKLSTAAASKIVAIPIGDVAAGTSKELPVFTGTRVGYITSIAFINKTAITQSDTNYTTLTIKRETPGGAAGDVLSINTKVTGGVNFQAYTTQFFDSGFDYNTFSSVGSNTFSFKKTDSGAGAALDDMLLIIEFIYSS